MLADGREEHALSPGFIDCMTAFINYEWANQMITYTRYSSVNGVLGRILSFKSLDRRVVPPDYYDFLREIPLVDEEAIGVGEYRRFVENALDLEVKSYRPTRLSDKYKLSGLGLSPAVLAQLDSMYEANRIPRLSEMIDLSGLGLAENAQSQLDSMYQMFEDQFNINTGGIRAAEKAAWLGLELSPAEQSQLDAYEGHRMAYNMEDIDTTMIDTTGGRLTFHMPVEKINEWSEYLQNRPLSAKVDLSSLGLSLSVQAQLDSMYQDRFQNRQLFKPSPKG